MYFFLANLFSKTQKKRAFPVPVPFSTVPFPNPLFSFFSQFLQLGISLPLVDRLVVVVRHNNHPVIGFENFYLALKF